MRPPVQDRVNPIPCSLRGCTTPASYEEPRSGSFWCNREANRLFFNDYLELRRLPWRRPELNLGLPEFSIPEGPFDAEA